MEGKAANMADIVLAKTDEDIKAISEIAEKVWGETYGPLLPPGQLEYMLEKFQSVEAIKRQISQEGYQYYMFMNEAGAVGFMGISPDNMKPGELLLSKIYLLKEHRGKGIISKAFAYVKTVALESGMKSIWLTVNKENKHAQEVYLHYGFEKTDSVVTDIGQGYVMDDYIMTCKL